MDRLSILPPAFLLGFALCLAPSCSHEEHSAAPAGQNATASSQDSLAVIAADQLKDKVLWLADDAREGRRTGTEGERASAQWIIQQLEAAGAEPAGSDGGWIQEFPVKMAPEEGRVELQVEDMETGEVHTVAASASDSIEGVIRSVNYGLVMPSHGMNDYAEAEVNGKIALARRYTEMGPNADPTFAALGNLRNKVKNAQAEGAVGVILGTHPDDLAKGGEEWIAFDAIRGSMTIPVLVVSSKTFADLEQAAQGDSPPMIEMLAEVTRETRMAQNVLGILPGKTPELMVIGGHYDHLGYGGDGSLAPGVHEIHNGADDNASGTAMVIELAESLAARSEPLQRGVVFALWSGEEMGLLGSQYWTRNPTVAAEDIVMNLNLDMVGRLAEGRVTVGSSKTGAAFGPALDATVTWAKDQGLEMRLDIIQNDMPGGGGSDHMSFHQIDVPAVFFFSGLHSDYHKPSDDADKIAFDGMVTLGRILEHFLLGLDTAPSTDFVYVKPVVDPHSGNGEREVAAAKVWFGSIPDYGAEPEGGGMQIAGTSPGSPAEKAGLLKGDIIRKVGDVAVIDIYDFMDALAKYENGMTIDVSFEREGESKKVSLTFFPRASNGD
jgi:hypothetical protein